MPCCSTFGCAAAAQFTPKKAAEELARYREKGPGVTTRFIRDGLIKAGVASGTLLDVGAGIGALTFELLDRGITNAMAVDASEPYLAAAKDEATRRGRSDAISFTRGDFVEVAADLPVADIVTLDRVVCCYPDYAPLLDSAIRHAARALAFSYPRDRTFIHWGVRIENATRQLRSNPFRTFVHPVQDMQQRIRAAGFELAGHNHTMTWAADVYARDGATQR